jgi:hypothetical protein
MFSLLWNANSKKANPDTIGSWTDDHSALNMIVRARTFRAHAHIACCSMHRPDRSWSKIDEFLQDAGRMLEPGIQRRSASTESQCEIAAHAGNYDVSRELQRLALLSRVLIVS